jgi:hypothetical protein
MSFGSWLKNLFTKHKIAFNPKTIAAAMAVAKESIDQLATVEPALQKELPQIDQAFESVITALGSWKSGQPTAEISQSLAVIEGVLNSVQAIAPQTKVVIDGVIAIVQTDLALMAPAG